MITKIRTLPSNCSMMWRTTWATMRTTIRIKITKKVRNFEVTLASQLLALLLNEIDAFNETHKNDLEATEAMEMELEGKFCSLIKLMWFRGSCI